MKFFKNVFPNLIILISPVFLFSIFFTPKQAEARMIYADDLSPYNCVYDEHSDNYGCSLKEVSPDTLGSYPFGGEIMMHVSGVGTTYGQGEPIKPSLYIYGLDTSSIYTVMYYITKADSNLQSGTIYTDDEGQNKFILKDLHGDTTRSLFFDNTLENGDYDLVIIVHIQNEYEYFGNFSPHYSGVARIPFKVVDSLTVSNCTIPTGHSACNTNISWKITNPITGANTAVTTPTNITVGTGTSGSTTYTVSHGTRDFYLYHNGQEYNSATATASCVSGVTWNATDKVCGEPLKTPKITFSMVNNKNNEPINVSLGTLLGVPILRNTSSILANDPIEIKWIVENPEAFNLSNTQCTANGVLQPKGHIDGFFTVYPSTTTKYSVHCTDE